MFSTIANLFGYLLNFLYNIINNYGLAIILFTILVKVLMLPLTIKQQKNMIKSSKIQKEMNSIQFKYKNNPEMMNKEIMELYKREKMNPMSGCFSSVVQIILILSVFYMVRSPLTYMRKIDSSKLEEYKKQYVTSSTNYPEIEIIRNVPETEKDAKLNMQFLGLDLSSIPNVNYKDYKSFIIPALYVISSIVSMKITMKSQNNLLNKNKENGEESENTEKENKTDDENQLEAMQSMNKSMSYMMPIMAVSISLIAPLGLGLYWLVSNLLMIGERLLIDNVILKEEK